MDNEQRMRRRIQDDVDILRDTMGEAPYTDAAHMANMQYETLHFVTRLADAVEKLQGAVAPSVTPEPDPEVEQMPGPTTFLCPNAGYRFTSKSEPVDDGWIEGLPEGGLHVGDEVRSANVSGAVVRRVVAVMGLRYGYISGDGDVFSACLETIKDHRRPALTVGQAVRTVTGDAIGVVTGHDKTGFGCRTLYQVQWVDVPHGVTGYARDSLVPLSLPKEDK